MSDFNEIVSTRKEALLPSGTYKGRYSGCEIKIRHNGVMHFLETKEGVRGINIPVTVKVENAAATFEIDK